MIILDTNVVSALMRPHASPDLQPWLDTVAWLDLYTTVITRAELRYGIARLPRGSKRTALGSAADAYFAENAQRILPFDSAAADRYGVIVAHRERNGRPVSVPDAQIAAIAGVHRASVATHDLGGFADCGIVVVDPFLAPS